MVYYVRFLRNLVFVMAGINLLAPGSMATEKSISQGQAQTVKQSISLCQKGRVSAVGAVTAMDGKVFTVPAVVHYERKNLAVDLHNGCRGVKPSSIGDVDLNAVPIVAIDADGDVVTGLIFADNYFELYVNGQLIGVDAIPFTPFNASIIRFRVKRPYVIAVKLVDWEENLGLGTEQNRGTRYHAGDGGFVASFSDGTVTDSSWQAYPYYVAPIADLKDAQAIDDVSRDTSKLPAGRIGCTTNCYGVHYPVPGDWSAVNFDASHWPMASEYTNRTVGVNNKPAYMNFKDQFIDKGAKFIWSPNLVTDNLVLVRKVIN